MRILAVRQRQREEIFRKTKPFYMELNKNHKAHYLFVRFILGDKHYPRNNTEEYQLKLA